MNRPAPITSEPDTSRQLMRKLSVSVDQVDDDIRNDLPVKHRRFVVAHRSNNPDEFKVAAEALVTHLLGIVRVVSRIVENIK